MLVSANTYLVPHEFTLSLLANHGQTTDNKEHHIKKYNTYFYKIPLITKRKVQNSYHNNLLNLPYP